jgi:M6 family metalloprotease-like protein
MVNKVFRGLASLILLTALSESAVAAKVDLSKDKRISVKSNFASAESCMTIDKTMGGNEFSTKMTSGFPRPATTKYGSSSVKIYLLPVSFSDYKFTSSDKKLYEDNFKKVQIFFSQQSYGRFKPEFIFPPESDWLSVSGDIRSYDLENTFAQQTKLQAAKDIFSSVPANLDLTKYDGVIIATPFYRETGGAEAFLGQNLLTKNGEVTNAMMIYGRGLSSWSTIAHEMGHAIFGLEDLYLFQRNSDQKQNTKNFTGWDLMAGTTPDFSGWNRLLMGFINKDEVRCVKKQSKEIIYLSGTNKVDGPKIGVINLEPGVSICFEVKKDLDGKNGLLLYKVDTNFDHGNGPFAGEEDVLKVGKSQNFEGAKFKVLGSSATGLLVQVSA